MPDKKPIHSAPPSLVGKKHYLRPASPEDIKNCYHWIMLAEPQSLSVEPVRLQSGLEASESYKAESKSDSEQTFMVVAKESHRPIGLIRYQNYNSLNRSAEIFWQFDPDDDLDLKPAEGIQLLINYLFAYRDLNKLIVTAREGDKDRDRLIEKLGFKKEGAFRQHLYLENKLHDLNFYSLLRFEYGGIGFD